jgi:hypothetical protein
MSDKNLLGTLPPIGGFSFRLNGKVFQSESVTCLYRGVDPEAMAARFVMLTKDGRFAYLDRVIGGKGIHAAEEWSADRARTFLMQHGESDIVEEFPDIFRKRPVTARPAKPRKPAKDSAAEPFLFPLH